MQGFYVSQVSLGKIVILGGFNGGSVVLPNQHALQTQTAGTWENQSSAARITDDGCNPDPGVSGSSPLSTGEWNAIKGTAGVVASITAYCGGAIDAANSRLIVSSGGHSDYLGNGTTSFSYATIGSEAYSAISWPSATIASDNSGINPDGTPDSRHTYSALVVHNGYLYMSGTAVNINAAGSPLMWRQNLSTGAWTGLTASDLSGLNNAYATCMAYDSASDLIWCWNLTDLFTIDPDDFTSSGVVQRLNNLFSAYWSFNGDTSKTCAIDVSKGKMLVTGHQSVVESVVFDISTPASTTAATPTWSGTGATAFNAISRAGLTYDSTNQDLVGWVGGTSVYAIDVDNETITTVSPSGSNAVTPTSMTTNGVCNRFAYDSAYDAFILINGNEDAYYYKRA